MCVCVWGGGGGGGGGGEGSYITLLFAGQVQLTLVCFLYWPLFSCAGVLEHPLDTPLDYQLFFVVDFHNHIIVHVNCL